MRAQATIRIWWCVMRGLRLGVLLEVVFILLAVLKVNFGSVILYGYGEGLLHGLNPGVLGVE